jgi:hypothetical protein
VSRAQDVGRYGFLSQSGPRGDRCEILKVIRLRLFELALVPVRLDHVARFIANANHGIM